MSVSVRSKFILAIGVPLAVVYGCILAIHYRAGKATALSHMESHLTELTAHCAARLDAQFSTSAQVARSTATFLAARPDTREAQLYDLLQNVLKDNPGIFGACIAFDPDGFEPGRSRFAPYVCRDKDGLRRLDVGAEAYDYALWDWYLIPRLLDRAIWTDPYCDVGAGNVLMCTYSVPFGREGGWGGVATTDISLDTLRDELRHVRIGQGYTVIVGQNGVFISHPDASLIMRDTMFSLAEWHEMPALAELGRAMIAGECGIRRIRDRLTQEPQWAVFAPIRSCGWSLAAIMPEAQVLAPVQADLRRDMALMTAGLAVILGVVLLTAIHVTRPISRLAEVVQQVASGRLDVQATDIHARDEIGAFARTFNRMVSDLRAHVDALTRETAAREAVESELRIARNIQTSLLPRTFPPFPNRPEFSLWAVNVPAKKVAGDFFDFYFVSEHELLITIADVSGKGIPAAMFMAVTRTLLRNLAQTGLGPAEILRQANAILVQDNDESMFVTLIVGVYHTQTGRLRLANAGHPPPYHLDAQGRVSPQAQATGTVLGVIDGQRYGDVEIALRPGDTLVLYTDGVTEAHSPSGDLYGDKRLESLLAKLPPGKVEGVSQAIVQAVNEFQQGRQFDDITLLVFRRNG